MAKCSSCGAEIVWIKMALSGRPMPCDEKLVPYKYDAKGKDIVITPNGEAVKCRLKFEGMPTGLARLSHWATCPNANQHRKSRR